MKNYDKVQQALLWLDDEGWSELIDPRWTLEVYHELQTSKLNLKDEDIRETLDIVIYDKPDYNPANNERLVRGMTEDSPKYKDYICKMLQCKKDAETEDPRHSGFFDLSKPHEKADEILCNLLMDLGFKDIVDVYKSFDKWHA